MWSHAINGGTVHCCPDSAELFQYALDVRPTLLSGVPRVWEKLYTALRSGIASEPDPARRRAVEQAIDGRRQLVRLQQRRLEVPAELAAHAERAAPICQAIRSRVGLDQCDGA